MLRKYEMMNMGNKIAGYLLNFSWEEMKVAKRGKKFPLGDLKKLPPLHLKRVGGLGD